MYLGEFFALNIAYIKKVTDRFYILSAKYGLLHPEQIIEPYELHLRIASAKYRARWMDMTRKQIAYAIPKATMFVTTASKEYRLCLPPERTICPWNENSYRLGEQRHWLITETSNPSWRIDQLLPKETDVQNK